MSTIKFTIEKTEKQEVEFEVPCYRKNQKKNKIFKIISGEEIYELDVMAVDKFSLYKWTIVFTDLKESEPATDQDWKNGLKKLANHYGQFMCTEGLDECGYLLPEPEEEIKS